MNVKQGQHTVFATGHGFTWRSTDGGAYWEKIPELPKSSSVLTDGANVLASSGGGGSLGFQLLQSADDGFTWAEVFFDPLDSLGHPFRVFGTYVYASKNYNKEVYRSKDFGATWEFVSNEPFGFTPDEGKMYRSEGYALLESSDGGFAWDTLLVLPNYIKLQLKKGPEILLSSWTPQDGNILYFSKDKGETWTTLSIPTAEQYPYDIFTLHQGKLYAFRRYSTYALVADLSVGVFEDLELPENSLTAYAAISTGEKLLRATLYSGVTLSSDGDFWYKAEGISTGAVLQDFDGDMYATPGTGVYRLEPDKEHWELAVPDSELKEVRGMAVDGNYVTFASTAGKVWVSSDGGQTLELGKNEDGSTVYGIYRMEEAGGQLFGWDYGGLRIIQPRFSDDHGLTWKSLSPAIGNLFPTRLSASNGHLYLCDTLELLYRWDAAAQTFEQISATPLPFAGSKESLHGPSIFVKDDTYLVTEPAGSLPPNIVEARYFVSTDAGQSWAEHLLGLGSVGCSGDTIYATGLGLSVGISTDEAATWQPFSEGMEEEAAWLEIFEGEVFASTPNEIYRRKTNGEMPSVLSAEPSQFSRVNVCPNPFHDHFSVQISTPATAPTTRLYDMLGRAMALPAGHFSDSQIFFAGMEHLPRGVYFLEIHSGENRSVQKLTKW